MKIPSNACCIGGPDREDAVVSERLLLTIFVFYGVLSILTCAVAFFFRD